MKEPEASAPRLTARQLADFTEHGYVHVPGLVARELCRAAEAAVWDACGVDRQDPASWPEGWYMPPEAYDLPQVQACGSAALRSAVDQLTGHGRWMWGPFGPRHPGVGVIIIRPHRGMTAWESPLVLRDDPRPALARFYPHVDQYREAGVARWRRFVRRVLQRAKLARRAAPSTFALNIMVYLHDVPAQHGATLLWPGSFRDVQQKAIDCGVTPAEVLKQRLLEPGERFLEATGATGDALLYTRNLVHSPSPNMSSHPRVALQIPVHLTRAGMRHCRRGTTPRTPVEQIYDEYMTTPHPAEYFTA